jgi:transposase
MGKRRRHSEEFKREAVKLLKERGYGMSEAARSLGIHPNLLRAWQQKYSPNVSQEGTMPESEAEELRRLREEVRRLRMERDILKKAAVFFANERN